MSQRKFYSNTRLYSRKSREFFQREDPRNPAGHEPDWSACVAMRPAATETLSVEELESMGYVGIYERLPGDEPTVIADDDPRRSGFAMAGLLDASSPSALFQQGVDALTAFELSARFEDMLVEAI